LDTQILKIEGVSRKIRYRIPFYDFKKWICYLNPIKEEGIEICFLEGQKMSVEFEELDLRGRKKVAGMIIDANNDVDLVLILKMIRFAIDLNK